MKNVWEIVIYYHGVIKHRIEFKNRRKLNAWLIEYLKGEERVWTYDLYLEWIKTQLIKEMSFNKFVSRYVKNCVNYIYFDRQKILFIKRKKFFKK